MGHHLWGVTDKAGKTYYIESSPILKWGHLLMRPHEMHRYLLDHTDFETADEIVYHVYHSEILNRLFFEDYEAYFAQSKFEKIEISKFMPDVKPDPETQQRLEHLHPGRKDFSTTGILVVAEKEPEPALSLLRSDVPGARGNAARCGVSCRQECADPEGAHRFRKAGEQ